MFKNIEYVGFEGHPDIRQMVENLAPSIEKVLQSSSDRISLEWVLNTRRPTQPRVPEVELSLTDDWAGTGKLVLPLNFGLAGVERLVRNLHSDMLNRFLEHQVDELKRDYAASVGN